MKTNAFGFLLIASLAVSSDASAETCGGVPEIHDREPLCHSHKAASCGTIDLYNACMQNLVFFARATRIDSGKVRSSSCEQGDPPAKATRPRADDKVIGLGCTGFSKRGPAKVTFALIERYKGDLGRRVVVEVDGANFFEAGKTYLVFAYYALPNRARAPRSTNLIVTSRCLGSHAALPRHVEALRATKGELRPLPSKHRWAGCLERVKSMRRASR